jgi:hypothetical protein
MGTGNAAAPAGVEPNSTLAMAATSQGPAWQQAPITKKRNKRKIKIPSRGRHRKAAVIRRPLPRRSDAGKRKDANRSYVSRKKTGLQPFSAGLNLGNPDATVTVGIVTPPEGFVGDRAPQDEESARSFRALLGSFPLGEPGRLFCSVFPSRHESGGPG